MEENQQKQNIKISNNSYEFNIQKYSFIATYIN